MDELDRLTRTKQFGNMIFFAKADGWTGSFEAENLTWTGSWTMNCGPASNDGCGQIYYLEPKTIFILSGNDWLPRTLYHRVTPLMPVHWLTWVHNLILERDLLSRLQLRHHDPLDFWLSG